MRLDMASVITVHPEAASLLTQIDRLRDRLESVIEKTSLLKYREKDVLVALYAKKIGILEYQFLCTQIEIRALRRRIELVTSRLNHGADITDNVLREIDAEIEAEITDWRAKVRQQEEELKTSAAIFNNLTELDRETQGRIKSCYRKLCRMLHPDIVGKETDLYRLYWQDVQDAYSVCDADLLEGLLSVVEAKSNDAPSATATPFDELTKEMSRLERLIEKQVGALTTMRGKIPFCYEALLQDEKWVRKKQQSLKTSITANHEESGRLQATLEFLIQPKPQKLH